MNSTPKTTNTTAEPVAHSTTTATAPAHVVKAVVTTKKVAATKPMVKAESKQTKVGAVAKPARKVAAKTAPKPAPKPDAKPFKTKKPKMVRDSFTMPKAEFAVIETLKVRAAALKVPTKKTEMIRAGIKALAEMSDTAFLNAVRAVPNLKTGRPAKDE
jgi:hypothetical protein